MVLNLLLNVCALANNAQINEEAGMTKKFGDPLDPTTV